MLDVESCSEKILAVHTLAEKTAVEDMGLVEQDTGHFEDAAEGHALKDGQVAEIVLVEMGDTCSQAYRAEGSGVEHKLVVADLAVESLARSELAFDIVAGSQVQVADDETYAVERQDHVARDAGGHEVVVYEEKHAEIAHSDELSLDVVDRGEDVPYCRYS